MPDKITGAGFRPAEATGPRRTDERASGEAQASGAAPRAAGDTVHLTQSALLMGKLEEKLAAVPVVDAERVAALKAAISSGSYAVDAAAVAERMIRSERELGV